MTKIERAAYSHSLRILVKIYEIYEADIEDTDFDNIDDEGTGLTAVFAGFYNDAMYKDAEFHFDASKTAFLKTRDLLKLRFCD